MTTLSLLLLILLSLSTRVLADEEDGMDLDRCLEALQTADGDGDGRITQDEHAAFIEEFSGSTDYSERPLALRGKFYYLACLCLERGESVTCCDTDNASILIDNEDDRETVCILTVRVIQSIENPETAAPSAATSLASTAYTSVWLRTEYQVILGDSAYESLVTDLENAMNVLVPQVLEEEINATQTRRKLQQPEELTETLPTQVETHLGECPEGLGSEVMCENVTTFSYVVGPSDLLNETVLDEALQTAIVVDGRLQPILEQQSPSTPIQVLDQETVEEINKAKPPTNAPSAENLGGGTPPPGNTNEDTDGWTVGGLVGVCVAGVALLGLAIGLFLVRKHHIKSAEGLKSEKESVKLREDEMLVDHSISNSDVYMDEFDLEGQPQQTSLGYQEIPMDEDIIPTPAAAGQDDHNSHLLLAPAALLGAAARKEPSDGDLGASITAHHDSGGSGLDNPALVPVGYCAAMGLAEGTENENDDDGSSHSSSSSSESDDVTTDDEDDSVSESSSGSSSDSSSDDKDRDIKGASSHGEREIRVLPIGVSQADISEVTLDPSYASQTIVPVESASSATVPAETPSAGVIAAAMVGVAAAVGVAVYAGARYGSDTEEDEEDSTPPANQSPATSDILLEHISQVSSAPTSASETVPTSASAAVPANAPDAGAGPNAGVIAAATVGAVGLVAAGGAALYAATRPNDDNKEDLVEDSNPAAKETQADDAFVPPESGSCAPNASKAVADGVPSDEPNAGIIAAAAVGGVGVAAAGGAAIYAAMGKPEDDELEESYDDDVKMARNALPQMESEGDFGLPAPSVDIESFSTISDPVAVGEESTAYLDSVSAAQGIASYGVIHDRSAVDESESETESSGSEFSSDESEGSGDSDSATDSVKSDSDSESESEAEEAEDFMTESQPTVDTQTTSLTESKNVQGPPPRPPSPTEDGLSTGAAATIGVGVLSAGAMATYFASRNEEKEEKDKVGKSIINTPIEERTFDSQQTVPSSTSSVHHGYEERMRPPPSGRDHPYYSAAAAIAAGTAATSLGNDDLKTTSELAERSPTDANGALNKQKTPVSPNTANALPSSSNVVPSAPPSDTAHEGPSPGMIAGLSAGAVAVVAAGGAAIYAATRKKEDDRKEVPPQTGKVQTKDGADESSVAAAISAGALTAAALSSGPKSDDGSESGASSSESGSEYTSSDVSSTGKGTDAATLGQRTESKSTVESPLNSSGTMARSSSTGAISLSTQSFETDGAVMSSGAVSRSLSYRNLGPSSRSPGSANVDGSSGSQSAAEARGSRSTQESTMNSSNQGRSTTSGLSSDDATDGAVADDHSSSRRMVRSAQRPRMDSSESKSGIFAGITASAMFAFNRRSSRGSLASGSASGDENTLGIVESKDEGVIANLPVVGPRSISRSTLVSSLTGSGSNLRGSRSSSLEGHGSSRVVYGRDGSSSVIHGNSSGKTAFAESGSGTLTFPGNDSAALTDSGDTFEAMEEAALAVTPDDVNVEKSRFAVQGPEQPSNEPTSVCKVAAAATVGAGALAVGAAAALAISERESKSHEAATDEESSDGETSSDESTSGPDNSSGSESDPDSDSSDDSDSSSESGVSQGSTVSFSSGDHGEAIAAAELTSLNAMTAIAIHHIESGSQMPPRTEENKTRPEMLRAMSDAALPPTPHKETVAALLKGWDRDYDIAEGNDSGSDAIESLVGMGLAPIQEAGGSDDSSQDFSHSEAAMPPPHSSSSLLNFDYSLNTIHEHDDESRSSRGGESSSAISSSRRGLDSITERSESRSSIEDTPKSGHSRKTLNVDPSKVAEMPTAASHVGGQRDVQDANDSADSDSSGGSYVDSSTDSSSDGSESSSSYTTDSDEPSDDSESSSGSEESSSSSSNSTSSTSNTPEPSMPSRSATPDISDLARTYVRPLGAIKGQSDTASTDLSSASRGGGGGGAAPEQTTIPKPAEAWATIATEVVSKTMLPTNEKDAPAYAIERSLSALQQVSFSSSLTQSHGSLSQEARSSIESSLPESSSNDESAEVIC